MFSVPKKSWFIYYLFISCFFPIVKPNIEPWMEHLRRHFQEHQIFYQIVILSEGEKPTPLISKELVRNIPTLRISFENLENKTTMDFLNEKSFGEPRSTTLFIRILEFEETTYKSKMQHFVNFLNKLVPIRSLPKCLIIFVQKKDFNYKNLLHHMWENRFLDVTILHLMENPDSRNIFQVSRNHTASVHHYNPFTDVYFSGKLVTRFENWFPNKVRNMNGYEIKAGLIAKPPHSFVTRNSTGHPISYTGADVRMFQAVSKALNFTSSFPPSNIESLGVINRANKSASGFIGDLVHHRINVLVNPLVRTRPPKDQLWEYSVTVDVESLRAIVPILPARAQFDRHDVFLTVIFFVFTNIFIRIVSRILKFDPGIWQGVDIAQMLLGSSAFHVPLKTAERILFMSVLLVSFINVTILYAGFTSSRLISRPEIRFDTFEALDTSGLSPIILKNFFSVTFDSADGAVANLGNKTIKWDSDEIGIACPKYLDQHKNITCLLVSSEAVVAMRAAESGVLVLKIMKPSFWSCGTAMGFETGSPYVDEFNKVLMRLTEAGLRVKWLKESHDSRFKNNDERKCVDDNSDDEDNDDDDVADDNVDGEKLCPKTKGKRLHIKINRTLLFIVFYGGSISFVIFISEFVFNYFRSYVASKKEEVRTGAVVR